MRRVWNKSQDQIAHEWDSIAEMRSKQIRTGQDVSYEHVLTPTILEMIRGCDLSSVVDVGCGCGFLTAKLAGTAKTITGIDISANSIRLAKAHCHEYANIEFVEGAIEELANDGAQSLFSLAVANMSLMATLRLDPALNSISRLVRPGGHLAFTITHPCFWPQYWKYSKEWFRYDQEVVIEAPFHISLDQMDVFTTTHVHRPIDAVCNRIVFRRFPNLPGCRAYAKSRSRIALSMSLGISSFLGGSVRETGVIPSTLQEKHGLPVAGEKSSLADLQKSFRGSTQLRSDESHPQEHRPFAGNDGSIAKTWVLQTLWISWVSNTVIRQKLEVGLDFQA